MDSGLWLSYILFSCPYKLTSKDKLVATYLTYFPKKNGFYSGNNIAHVISQKSGLAVRTVQKSIGRLAAIGYVSFITNSHFLLETVS